MGWEDRAPDYPAEYADYVLAGLDALGWALTGILLAAILTGGMVAIVLASLRVGG